MSTNHHERIERVVDKALKEAAMGEQYGFAVSTPSIWPLRDEKGNPTGAVAPAWFVIVTIRGGLGEPDLGNGFPVYGILPTDDDFAEVARGLLERCRQDRSKVEAEAMLSAAVSGDEVLRKMREGAA